MTESKPTGICPVCRRDDITLTKNGRVRSHGPRETPCGGGSMEPLPPQDVPQATEADAARARVAAGLPDGPNPHRSPLPTGRPSWAGVQPFHGLEPDEPPTEPEDGMCPCGEPNGLHEEGCPNDHGDPAADEADAWLAGPAAVMDEGDDYFAGPDAPEASGRGRYFYASYDGDCDVCLVHYDEGDEIRADGSGGWQGKECCGQEEDEGEAVETRVARPARQPQVLRPKVPVENGRYVMPHPLAPGKSWRATRVTTFVKLASDHYSLKLWELRTALVGATLDEDVRAAVASLLEFGESQGNTPSDVVKVFKNDLNGLVERAKSAAGAGVRAAKGTALHKWGEEVDAGRTTLDQVPSEHRDDIRAYRSTMEAAGITVLPHLIERTTAVLGLGVMGTFDRVFRMPDGKYRVGDKKSGELKYGQDEIAAQMSIYARGCNETGMAEYSGQGNHRRWQSWRWVPLVDEDGQPVTVETDWGVVMHLPQGEGQCTLYEVDLATGMRGAELCSEVRDWHRVKSTMSPLAVPDPETPLLSALPLDERAGEELAARVSGYAAAAPETAAETVRDWGKEMANVTGRDEALDLWRQARDAGLPQSELDAYAQEAKRVLARLAAPPGRDWQAEFAAVQDRNGALALWHQAGDAGLGEDDLAVLGTIAKAVLVTDRDGAREAYNALAEHVRAGRLGRERLDGLRAVMMTRVPA